MADRSRTTRPPSAAPGSKAPQKPRPDDALNDRIQAVLRGSADSLAERTRVQSAADAEAAGLQLDEILALARSRNRSPRT